MKNTILKLVGQFAGVILVALIFSLPFAVNSVNAQNKGVKAGASKKASKSERSGKKSKSKKKSKNKKTDDDNDEPKVVKLPPRTGDFNPGGPISKEAKSFGITPAIRDMPEVINPKRGFDGEIVIKDEENNEVEVDRTVDDPALAKKPFTDPLALLSRRSTSLLSPQAMPGPALSFNGILSADLLTTYGTTSMPPDTIGDVGPNHYVQSTNFGNFRVFNKSGTPLTATARISSIFAGLPASDECRTGDNGDPVVNYDPLADRWMISQFYVQRPTFGQCIAVSQTGDPTGAWYAYNFPSPAGNFPDYPHWAVWTDGYYLATHEFNAAGTAYVTGGFYAFNRNKMLVGDPTANFIYFTDPNSFGHLPADVDGYLPPPAGTSEYFLEFDSVFFGGTDRIVIHELVPDFTTPASSTFTLKTPVPVAAFDPRDPTGRADIEQPVVASSAFLDSIGGQALHRVAYRNLGTDTAPVNSYVTNLTVNVSGVAPSTAATYQAAIRWEELRRSGAGVMSVFDQGTHAPDPVSGTGRNRWMGSIAQDYLGNIGLGFSRSGSGAADFPDIVWAGRTGGQTAAGVLNEGEATMKASTGYQSSGNRWGDYSSMTVDPTDDCTFWFTQEWRDSVNNGTASNNQFKWSTQIGNFKFPGCTAAPKGQIASNVTDCNTNQPISGVSVFAQPGVVAQAGGFFRMTNASGNLITNIIAAPGTYTVSGFKSGYSSSTTATVSVTDGNTVIGNICLTGIPILELGNAGISLVSESNVPANNTPDPGEMVTVSLPLKNSGAGDTNTVTATLQNSGGIIPTPPTTQNYGVIAVGTTVSRNFAFKVPDNAVCGSSITLTFQVQDGASSYTFTKTYTLGTRALSNSENFNGVTAPALPAGWTSTATGVGTGWATSTAATTSAPNSVFAGDPSNVGLSNLESPGWSITSSDARLDFRINYNTENTYDGAVLEIKIGAGAYQDIIAAGGSFNSGGYTVTLNTGFSNPLPGRSAWSGNSSGFILSSVKVPASANGQTVQFRWRMGSDSSVAGQGVYLDDIQLFGGFSCSMPPQTTVYEGDVILRPNGDGFVDADDIQQIRNFSVGGGLPYQSNEFQRADSSPRSTSGDGFVDGDDVQQARRYSVGTDPLQLPGGPSSFAPPAGSDSSNRKGESTLGIQKSGNELLAAPAAFRIDAQNSSAGATLVVPIRVDTVGNEAGYTFSIAYDSTKLTNPQVVIGNGGGDVIFNAANPGQIGFSVTGFAGGTIAEGNNIALVNVTFTVPANAPTGPTNITFTSTPARQKASGVDPNTPLTPQPTYAGGTITITPPTAAEVSISGRVLTSNGRGLARAVVQLTDQAGNIRTARTNVFGYYSIGDVEVGQTVVMTVIAKRYQFAPQTISLVDNVSGFNFISINP